MSHLNQRHFHARCKATSAPRAPHGHNPEHMLERALAPLGTTTLINACFKTTIVPPPERPTSGRCRGNLGEVRANAGRILVEPGRTWPISGLSLTELGPFFAHSGKSFASFGQICPKSTDTGPTLVVSGPTWSMFVPAKRARGSHLCAIGWLRSGRWC